MDVSHQSRRKTTFNFMFIFFRRKRTKRSVLFRKRTKNKVAYRICLLQERITPHSVSLRTERFFFCGYYSIIRLVYINKKTALRFTATLNVLNGRFAPKSAKDDFSVKDIFLRSFSLEENKKTALRFTA